MKKVFNSYGVVKTVVYTNTQLEKTDEFPEGSTDLTLTLSFTYIPGSVKLFKNSGRRPVAAFTESGPNEITLTEERTVDDSYTVDYKYTL